MPCYGLFFWWPRRPPCLRGKILLDPIFVIEVIAFLALGLCLGSFANVLIWRVPRKEGWIWGRSHCPQCNKTIRSYDNIPILSFLLLRGRCRDCGVRIP